MILSRESFGFGLGPKPWVLHGFAMCGGMKLVTLNHIEPTTWFTWSLSVSFCRRDTHVDRSFIRSLALLQKVLQLLEFQSCSKVDANLSTATECNWYVWDDCTLWLWICELKGFTNYDQYILQSTSCQGKHLGSGIKIRDTPKWRFIPLNVIINHGIWDGFGALILSIPRRSLRYWISRALFKANLRYPSFS